MEIRKWHYYVIFNCVIIKYLEGKTISLNDVITAESQQTETFKTSLLPKPAAGAGKRYSVIKRLRAPSRIKDFLQSGFFRDHTHLGGSILSPLKYRKTYLIKSPLKPRKLKLISKSRYKRKNQSAKREINGNEELKQKYIPLLKSLSMFFNNILNSDSRESYEVKTKKYKRNRFYSEETFKVPRGSEGSDSEITESESQEEAVTVSPPPTTATSIITETPTTEATSTTANIITTRDFSAIRQDKDIPVLLPRNTFGSRGNDTGIGERSGATRYGNVERNITRHHGDHEHVAGSRENGSCTENNEENTHSVTRDGARGFRFPGATGNRNIGLFLGGNRTDSEKNISETETTDDHNRENQLETGRDETKSGRILQEPIRRLRGFISKDVNENTESVQPAEIREKSVVNVTLDNAGYQRLTGGSSPTAKENQKVRTGNETMILMNSLNFTTTQSNIPKKKSPVMMIFDGYSSVKHKNGQNKFSEKTIHIHS